jgi:hypothetical protein
MMLLPAAVINTALSRYVEWHGCHRPHQGLGGSTPDEVFHRRRRRRRGADELRDLKLTHLDGDARLPVYRRMLAG